jgi:hypothetical protein
MWRQPRRPQRSNLVWTTSSATGSWCRSLAEAERARVMVPRGKYLGERVGAARPHHKIEDLSDEQINHTRLAVAKPTD